MKATQELIDGTSEMIRLDTVTILPDDAIGPPRGYYGPFELKFETLGVYQYSLWAYVMIRKYKSDGGDLLRFYYAFPTGPRGCNGISWRSGKDKPCGHHGSINHGKRKYCPYHDPNKAIKGGERVKRKGGEDGH